MKTIKTITCLFAASLLLGCSAKKIPSWTDLDSSYKRNTRPNTNLCLTCIDNRIHSLNSNAAHQVYDPSQRAWTDFSNQFDGVSPRSGFYYTLTSAGESIYVLGYYDVTVSQLDNMELFQLNMATLTWTNYTNQVNGNKPAPAYGYSSARSTTCQNRLFYVRDMSFYQLYLETLQWQPTYHSPWENLNVDNKDCQISGTWLKLKTYELIAVKDRLYSMIMVCNDEFYIMVSDSCDEPTKWSIWFNTTDTLQIAEFNFAFHAMVRFDMSYEDAISLVSGSFDAVETYLFSNCEDGTIYAYGTSTSVLHVIDPIARKREVIFNSGNAAPSEQTNIYWDRITEWRQSVVLLDVSRVFNTWNNMFLGEGTSDQEIYKFDMNSLSWQSLSNNQTVEIFKFLFVLQDELFGMSHYLFPSLFKYREESGSWMRIETSPSDASMVSDLQALVYTYLYNLLEYEFATTTTDALLVLHADAISEDMNASSGVFTFNVTSMSWTRHSLADGSSPQKVFHSIAATDRYVYHFGGLAPNHNNAMFYTVFDNPGVDDWLYRFDLQVNVWSVLSKKAENSPASRLNPVMIVHKNQLYIYGGVETGIQETKTFSDLYSFDLDTLTWQQLFGREDSITDKTILTLGMGANLGKLFTLSSNNVISSRDFPRERKISKNMMLDLALANDWDTSIVSNCEHMETCTSTKSSIELCSRAWMPCHISLISEAGKASSLLLLDNANVMCDGRQGCTGIQVNGVDLICSSSRDTSVAPLRLVGLEAHLDLNNSAVVGCSSNDDGGSIQVYGGATADLFGVRIVGSRSGGAGGAVVLQGSTMNVVSSTFEGCEAREGGGAIHIKSQPLDYFPTVLSRPNLLIQSSSFLRNSGGQGGALHTESSATAIIRHSSFQENHAALDGGALFLQASTARLEGNSFQRNRAEGGGGGAVFWLKVQPVLVSDSDEDDPAVLCGASHTNNASYGSCVASGFYRLLLQIEEATIFPGIAFEVKAAKFDFYGQLIKTDSSLQIRTATASSRSGRSLVMGSSAMTLHEGVGQTNVTLKIYFVPSSSSPFPAQIEGPVVLEAYGSDAVSGEEMVSSVAEVFVSQAVCPVGYVLKTDSLSFPSFATCDKCLSDSYALYAFSGSNSSNPSCMRCPHGIECGGGEEIRNRDGFWFNRSALLLPRTNKEISLKAHRCADGNCLRDFKCRQGQQGRLCALCVATGDKDDFFWALSNGNCKRCDKGMEGRCKAWTKTGFLGIIRKSVNKHSSKIGYLKTLIGFVQISSSLISVYNIEWPDLIARLLSNIAFFSLDFLALPQISCTASDLSFSDKLLLFFIYLIYIPVSSMVLSTFLCQDLVEDGAWLVRDFRVPCPRTSGDFAYGWAIFTTLVYPVGFPLLIVYILIQLKVPALVRAKQEHAFFQSLQELGHLKEVGLQWDMESKRREWQESWETSVIDLLDLDEVRAVSRALRRLLKKQGLNALLLFQHHRVAPEEISLEEEKEGMTIIDLANKGIEVAEAAEEKLGEGGTVEEWDDKSERSRRVTDCNKPKRSEGENDKGNDEGNDQTHELGSRCFAREQLQLLYTEIIRREVVPIAKVSWYTKVEEDEDEDEDEDEEKQGGVQEGEIREEKETEKEGREEEETKIWVEDIESNANNNESEKQKNATEVRQDMHQEMLANVEKGDVESEVVEAAGPAAGAGAGAGAEEGEGAGAEEGEGKGEGKQGAEGAATAEGAGSAREKGDKTGEEDTNMLKSEKYALSIAGFLFSMYEVNFWWFEVFELVRRFFTCIFISFCFTGTIFQISVGLMLLFLSLAAHSYLKPFQDPSLDHMMFFALIANFATLLYGNSIKLLTVEELREDSTSYELDIVQALLVLANIFILVFPIIQTLSDTIGESAWQMARRCNRQLVKFVDDRWRKARRSDDKNAAEVKKEGDDMA
ncbi:hypothetical protein GUITHDRAFT_99762 [Guillardia theta CCMP2712]|uniref:TRP C-terminal domain-containing protein n=1 Tax=Guillardia theta (strain CCMP2712) TaxID=905079 RepID=L1K169_GUITC|nr:hypothetical protein GUITHDRAFT_99762 [Guillardia theta CCMP2712]EKX54284.1 hypothetical protein GUITHDRAFT_99762 [Guillardia theta CCMP2712]|eukprot:XP_005841264.1 hypothetical protein GUITHDRAFT_99762 [Guillardia theta CCMP2712]